MKRQTLFVLTLLALPVHAGGAGWTKVVDLALPAGDTGSMHLVVWINSKTIQKSGSLRTYDERVETSIATTDEDGKTSTNLGRVEINATVDCEHLVFRSNALASVKISVDGVLDQALTDTAKMQMLAKVGEPRRLAVLEQDQAWVCTR